MNVEQKTPARVVVGKVISNLMDKTIVVQVERRVMHPLYGKYIRKFSKMYAHDAENACNIGDTVEIQMCRPISKKKSWKLLQILDRTDKEIVG
ncbi:MAG TPA: 30S ribosomal protein S17 [Gammaproteobacteria bacterium]|nr:30S ribosomal protein S17 [Gammaproteobacteria bacterium]